MPNPILSLRELGATVLANEPMSAHTTFKIGGPARFFVQIRCEHLAQGVTAARQAGLEYMLVGNGSNLLFSDKGFNGAVFRLVPEDVRVEGECLFAPAGTALAAVAAAAAKEGLSGLEFAHGIPGTVGGAVFMNAGAYGSQISDILQESEYLDLSRPNAGMLALDISAHAFDYRESVFRRYPDWIVLRSRFKLARAPRGQIEQKMRELAERRREKQPLEHPSAGSVYKRPNGYFAGKLIEDCGLKGFGIGGAQVSQKHAGFIINRGGATCRDVLELMQHIEREVQARFNVRLEREVRLVGEP